MRAAVVAGLAVAWLLAARAHADPARPAFDHRAHDRRVYTLGKPELACAGCHRVALGPRGPALARLDHATCFGACHAFPAAARAPVAGRPLALADDDRARCEACHAPAILAAPYARAAFVAAPTAPRDPSRGDFAVTFGHASHAGTTCSACHAGVGVTPAPPHPPPHARCVGVCHDGATKGFAFASCASCHRAEVLPSPPRLVPPLLPIVLSHASHARRGGAGKACATCHADVERTDDVRLPRPTSATCAVAGCHDGAAAFSPRAAACSRCHGQAPTRTYEIVRPTTRYSHAQHARRVGEARACDACHRLEPAGTVAAATHEACTGGTACHDADFARTAPTICGACHTTTEPWRALALDVPPAEASEFGSQLAHATHAKDPNSCAGCHRLRTPTRQLRTPRGHAACATAGCHAVATGPAPRLGACTGCHVAGLERARDVARLAAPWSVRATFVHDRAHAAPCTSCHEDLRAADVRALATPAKARCAPCHDGKAAFKLTGTGCRRCHAGASS